MLKLCCGVCVLWFTCILVILELDSIMQFHSDVQYWKLRPVKCVRLQKIVVLYSDHRDIFCVLLSVCVLWFSSFAFRVADPSQKENLGIIVQYKVKVKLCLGALGGYVYLSISMSLIIELWNAMVLFTVIFPFLYISLFCTPYTLIIYFLSLLYEFLVTTVLSCCLFYFLYLWTMFSFVPLSSLIISFWSKVLRCCFWESRCVA